MDRVIDAGDDESIERAAAALADGELVVMPTDTLYGLAADAFNPEATRRVFAAKERSRSVPLPVLMRSPQQLAAICPETSDAAQRLMAAFWPGPMTLVLPAAPGLSWDLGDNDGTVAVRMPLDDVALRLIRSVGPLAVTSANRSGSEPATTAAEACGQLGGSVRFCLDDGPRTGGVPSTIVDLTRAQPAVLRVGVVGEKLALATARGEIEPLAAAGQLAEEQATIDGPDDPDVGL